jgi:3',5'-cyclic AMP phosphodiesterase CpdA
MTTKHFTLAQLSDTHICVPGGRLFNGVDSATQLQKALDWLLSEHITLDAVLISGDLTQDGRLEEYRHLRRLLTPIAQKVPVYLVLGNHDHYANFIEVFADYPGVSQTLSSQSLQYTATVGSYQLVVLDSLEPGDDQGHLNVQRQQWLDETLQASTAPCILVIHHPMIDIGNPLMDQMHLYERAAFGDIVVKHQHVQRILCGHIHRTIFGSFKNIPVIVAPSTAHQYPINLTRNSAKILSREAPGFLIHTQIEGGHIVTHQIPITAFADSAVI